MYYLFCTFYVLEAYLTHFSYRCWFLNCSVQKALWVSGGGVRGIVNSIRPVGGGEGWWGDKVNSLSPAPPSPYPNEQWTPFTAAAKQCRVGEGGGLTLPPPYPYNTCCSKTHVLKTHSIQYRIQNTENHVLKITNVPVFYMTLGLNDFDAGNIHFEGLGMDGPWKTRLFWALIWMLHASKSLCHYHYKQQVH